MKKVLFMIGMMNVGGIEKSLLSLLSVIPKDEYDITILMLEKKGGFLGDIPEWVKVEEASWFKEIKPIILQPPQHTVRNYYKRGKYLKIPLFVCTYLVSKRFDNRFIYYKRVLNNVPESPAEYDLAIAYQGPNDIIDYYIANKVKATKKISWVHFDVSKFQMNKRLYNKLYSKFDKIYVVSKGAKAKLEDRIPTVNSKTEVFMNIVSNKLVTEMSKSTVDFDEDYNGLKIVTVGRLSREKGQDIAINVLSKLRQEGYEIRWYCIGEGNQREEYEMLIKKRGLVNDFILLGQIPNPYPFVARSDIYVQTSRHEGYCLTLAEAKCLHKPIVTTSFVGADEQIIDGYNGLITETSEQELYHGLISIINNPLQLERLTSNLSKSELDTTAEIGKLLHYMK